MQIKPVLFGTLALLMMGAAGFAAARSLAQEPQVAHPTKEHEWLATLVGEWDVKMNGVMGESTGTNTIESGPGGFWNVTTFEVEMMGQPFKGIEILGYDPQKERFVSVWVDSMEPTLSLMEGSYDAEAKKLVMKGESVGLDGKPAEMTNITEYKDADTMVFTMNVRGPDGADASMMTIEYKRKK